MSTFAQDFTFVRAGLDELEAYLHSDVLFWPLSGPASLPRLTPGGLLLGLLRLRARADSPVETAQLAGLENQLQDARLKWRSVWEAKCRHEVHARLGLWQNFLADYSQSSESEAEAYPTQVQWRLHLSLLAHEVDFLSEEVEILADLDKMLQSRWFPDGFIWEPDLTEVFPEPEYWFLYGRLKS